MNTPQYEELQKAVKFLRQSFGDSMNLDYSVDSVKHLDWILGDAFKNGQVKNPTGTFAKYQGFIMVGITGYLAEVIIKNTRNSKLDIDPTDEQWYLTFKVVAENSWTIQPAHRVMKRAYEGKEFELYPYALSTVKYFNQPKSEMPSEGTYIHEVYLQDEPEDKMKKPWWKIW